jgi:carbon-monoxide dehydrogenase small subunit
MGHHNIQVNINGESEFLTVPSNLTLLQMIREKLGLTGTKNGCFAGECGACTVLLNGEPVNSCMVLAVECDQAEVVTIEGLAKDGRLNPVQQALMNVGAVQCGYCTPGMAISLWALLNRNPKPDEKEIREAILGNLCRCTGYSRLIRAAGEASEVME